MRGPVLDRQVVRLDEHLVGQHVHPQSPVIAVGPDAQRSQLVFQTHGAVLSFKFGMCAARKHRRSRQGGLRLVRSAGYQAVDVVAQPLSLRADGHQQGDRAGSVPHVPGEADAPPTTNSMAARVRTNSAHMVEA